MILGTGIDLTKISRFKKLINNQSFLDKFFNTSEIEYVKSRGVGAAQSLAGRFAAREAFYKALGTGFNGFNSKDITVINDSNGKPHIEPNQKVKDKLDLMAEKWSIHLSISHEKEYAIAQVILEA
ncbi:MAG: holo-ACP synthase [Spirochaetaceae bacterium]